MKTAGQHVDAIFFVNMPIRRERKEIFEIHLRKRGRSPDNFDVSALAGATNGFVGAEIEEAVVSGMYQAFSDDQREVTTNDILGVIGKMVPLSTLMAEDIRALTDWARNRARPASRAETIMVQEGRKLPVGVN